MLEAEDIVFSYTKGQKPVLDHVSLSVGPEERVGILGPSGYGKTTLMKILAGYQKPAEERLLSRADDLAASGEGDESPPYPGGIPERGG